jgi:hypothetical protein
MGYASLRIKVEVTGAARLSFVLGDVEKGK